MSTENISPKDKVQFVFVNKEGAVVNTIKDASVQWLGGNRDRMVLKNGAGERQFFALRLKDKFLDKAPDWHRQAVKDGVTVWQQMTWDKKPKVIKGVPSSVGLVLKNDQPLYGFVDGFVGKTNESEERINRLQAAMKDQEKELAKTQLELETTRAERVKFLKGLRKHRWQKFRGPVYMDMMIDSLIDRAAIMALEAGWTDTQFFAATRRRFNEMSRIMEQKLMDCLRQENNSGALDPLPDDENANQFAIATK